MTRRKDVHEIVEWARRRGWAHTDTNAQGHLVFTKPGCEPVTTGSYLKGRKMTGAQVALRRSERYAAQPAAEPEDPYMPDVDVVDRKEGDQTLVALRAAGCEITVQTVTPTQAAHWLEHNDHNPRRLRIPVAMRYAEDVRAGNWAFPTSFIGFSPTGELVNGQHTAWAIVEGGKPITTLVIYNVPDDAIAAMDRGLRRSLADTLHGNGIPRPRDLQSTIRLCWRWERNLHLAQRIMPTDAQCLEWLDKNPGAIDATVATVAVQRKARLKKSVIGPLFYRAMLIDADSAADFLDQLITGTGLEEGSPVLKLREYGVTSQVRKDRQAYDLAVAIKAWNAHVTGGRIYALRWLREGQNRERFPQMVDVDGRICRFDGKPMTDKEAAQYEDEIVNA